jgi:hypothetical protein
VVSTIWPLPPLTVSTSPFGAIVRPGGMLSRPFPVSRNPPPVGLTVDDRRGVPRSVDAVTGECLGHVPVPGENDQAARLSGGSHPVRRGHAAGDEPAARQDLQRGAQADAAGAARDLRWGDVRDTERRTGWPALPERR